MATRPVTADALTSSSATAITTSSSSFSSAPINPVVVSSHNHRRRAKSNSWFPGDVQNQNNVTGDLSNRNNVTDDLPNQIDWTSKSPPNQNRVITSDLQNQTTDSRDHTSSSYKPLNKNRSTKTRPFRAASPGSPSCSSGAAKNNDDHLSDNDQKRPGLSQALPSLSLGSAALLQLGKHQHSSELITPSPFNSHLKNSMRMSMPMTKATTGRANGPVPSTRDMTGERSRSGSYHYRGEGISLPPTQDVAVQDYDRMEEKESSAPSSSNTQLDARILFHNQEIWAEELIGLRVAKTFAGLGRFLGQVVKFDKQVALYTVVYADGDAEDLTVDQTLQILIEDEIERADPAHLPPDIARLCNKKSEERLSPASPDFMVPPASAQRQSSAVQPRVMLQISEREAQFVLSLFENHALPTLVRRGWRVQTGDSAKGTCFISPSKEILSSALDVVGYIAKDEELLTSCFPVNVHSAILSLLPHEAAASSTPVTDSSSNPGSTESASRKRTLGTSSSAEQMADKRTRQVVCDKVREGTAFSTCAGMARGGDIAHHRHDDLDHRAARHPSAYREQYMGGRIRPSSGQVVGNGGNISSAEAHNHASPGSQGCRSTSGHGLVLENPSGSRWPEAGAAINHAKPAECISTLGWREQCDAFALDQHVEVPSHNYIRAEERGLHPSDTRLPAYAESNAVGAAPGRHAGFSQDLMKSSRGNQADSKTNGLGCFQLSALHARSSDYSHGSTADRVLHDPANFISSADSHGVSVAFSMVDIDRISSERPRNARIRKSHDRSSQQSEALQSSSIRVDKAVKTATSQASLAKEQANTGFGQDGYGQYF